MNKNIPVRSIIAKNVRKYRKLNNLTQEKLAELADISNTYIANIECGKTWISDRTLEKISIALNTDVYMFFVPEPEETCKEDKYAMLENTYHRLNKSYDEFMNYCENVFFKEVREILGGSVVPDINGKN